MAKTFKAIALYCGSDSFGRNVQLAKSQTGKWFYRVKDGFWDRWMGLEGEPTFITTRINEYTREEFSVPEGEFISWGFKVLQFITNERLTFRLPG